MTKIWLVTLRIGVEIRECIDEPSINILGISPKLR